MGACPKQLSPDSQHYSILLLLTFLAAILACVLLRGAIPIKSDGETNFIAFQHLANAFLGMYMISSTENWTSMLLSCR